MKTRHEIELPLAAGAERSNDYGTLLQALGFRRVAQVCKVRTPFQLSWQGELIAGAIDQVDGVGLFVELEMMANEGQLQHAEACIVALTADLALGPAERQSYLELLLANQEP